MQVSTFPVSHKKCSQGRKCRKCSGMTMQTNAPDLCMRAPYPAIMTQMQCSQIRRRCCRKSREKLHVSFGYHGTHEWVWRSQAFTDIGWLGLVTAPSRTTATSSTSASESTTATLVSFASATASTVVASTSTITLNLLETVIDIGWNRGLLWWAVVS